ncbi:DUF7844 domain-containing protein [Lysobacter xanthus]
MHPAWRVLLAGALLPIATRARAIDVRIDTRGLGIEQAAAAPAIVDDTVRALPPAWAAALDRPLTVRWRDDLPAHVDGHYRSGIILLRRALLDDAARGDSRPARAALLHELAHAWDRSPRGGLSRDPRLLDLAGWQVAPLHLPRTPNAFHDRSPDAYEVTRPAEFVAVNLEHWMLDVEYPCRRPALYRYFAARAGSTATAPSCAPPVFVRADATGAADPSPVLTLDPSRIYAVDYLLAEPDARPMSRWGHAMLRLVVCAPGRAPGPDCRLDVAWHEVLSFRAFVDDVRVSAWRGVAGGYPSRLFVLPMPRVVDEYTKLELRGLRSVPLRLSREDIAAVVERAAQVHWSYDGRYRFVTANCAVETWRLLHDAVPRLADAPLSSLSPTGLLRRLEGAHLVDDVPRDASEALRLGYRFDSQAMHYQALLDTARASATIPVTQARDWFALDPAARARAFDTADVRGLAALLVLENAALRRAEQDAAIAFGRRIGRSGTRTAGPVDDALDLASRRAHAAAWVPAGYGIPDADERDSAQQALGASAANVEQLEATLRDLAEAALPATRRAALIATRLNVEDLGTRLRDRAAAARGD